MAPRTIGGDAHPRGHASRPGPTPRRPPATRWPHLSELNLRYRANFAYLQGTTTTDDYPLPLCRLRYLGSADQWGFAIYLASKDGYENSILPTGSFTGTPEQALDCACGLHLNDITAWTDAHDHTTEDSRDNF